MHGLNTTSIKHEIHSVVTCYSHNLKGFGKIVYYLKNILLLFEIFFLKNSRSYWTQPLGGTFCVWGAWGKCFESASRKVHKGSQKGLHHVFVDLEEEYNSVHRKGLWCSVGKFGVREKNWRAKHNVYKSSRTVVSLCVLSEWVEGSGGPTTADQLWATFCFPCWLTGWQMKSGKRLRESLCLQMTLYFLVRVGRRW